MKDKLHLDTAVIGSGITSLDLLGFLTSASSYKALHEARGLQLRLEHFDAAVITLSHIRTCRRAIFPVGSLALLKVKNSNNSSGITEFRRFARHG